MINNDKPFMAGIYVLGNGMYAPDYTSNHAVVIYGYLYRNNRYYYLANLGYEDYSSVVIPEEYFTGLSIYLNGDSDDINERHFSTYATPYNQSIHKIKCGRCGEAVTYERHNFIKKTCVVCGYVRGKINTLGEGDEVLEE